MGTWGSGNFDSDGASDARAELSDKLIAKIWKALQAKESSEADETDYDALFVNLEWLLTLSTTDALSLWNLPKVAEFDTVTTTWLEAWSAYFDGLSGPEFKAERRAVIEETFARFRVLCVTNEKDKS